MIGINLTKIQTVQESAKEACRIRHLISDVISPSFQKELDEMEETGKYDDSEEDALTPPETDWIADEIDD